MSLPDITTPDGRRAYAFAAIVGAAMTFTAFSAAGVYIVRENAGLSFWLALASQGQVAICIGSLGWVLGRRMVLSAGKDGLSTDDREQGK